MLIYLLKLLTYLLNSGSSGLPHVTRHTGSILRTKIQRLLSFNF